MELFMLFSVVVLSLALVVLSYFQYKTINKMRNLEKIIHLVNKNRKSDFYNLETRYNNKIDKIEEDLNRIKREVDESSGGSLEELFTDFLEELFEE